MALGFDAFPGFNHPDIVALDKWYGDEISILEADDGQKE
jgi:hypothetical protein